MARLPLFQKDADYAAFERVVVEALQLHPTRILGYCLMPNHWHFVLWPRSDSEITRFPRWLTHTHTMRWHTHYHSRGTGHLYQGRFKAFPIETGDHLFTVLRYVERNTLRAHLVRHVEKWRWSSLWQRSHDTGALHGLLSAWPVPLPADWVARVQAPQTEAELEAVRASVQRGSPFGAPGWQKRISQRLGLEYTLRPRGRPKKQAAAAAN